MDTRIDMEKQRYREEHQDEELFKLAIEAAKDSLRHIEDDLDYIRRILTDVGVFDTCETIDIAISENDIEFSAWNDLAGGYLFDMTLKEVQK